MSAERFGQLRSVLHTTPSVESWLRLQRLLDLWERQAREAEAIPYAAGLLAERWPDGLRSMPDAWLPLLKERAMDARLSLVRSFDLFDRGPQLLPILDHLARHKVLDQLSILLLPVAQIPARLLAKLFGDRDLLALRALHLESPNALRLQEIVRAPAMARLESLTLVFDEEKSTQALEALGRRQMPALRSLRLVGGYDHGALGGEGSFLYQLRRLALTAPKLEGQALRALLRQAQRFEQLGELDLSHTPVHDLGAAFLSEADFPALRRLGLRDTQISDYGARKLAAGAGLPVLERVDLRENAIDDDLLLAIEQTLPRR